MTTPADLMTVIFGAFASFTAFGAAIVAYLTAGGAVQRWAIQSRDHGIKEAEEAYAKSQNKEKREQDISAAQKRPAIIIRSTAIIIGLVVLSSGAGLVLGSLWFNAHADGSDGWRWAYSLVFDLFIAATVLLTGSTAFFIITSALSGLSGLSKTTNDSKQGS
jgi:hypothetical protein